jgi:predicted N-acetyltransferase YhbS
MAFATCPYGERTEQFIISALRTGGALAVSLAAEGGDTVVGHAAFSPATLMSHDEQNR